MWTLTIRPWASRPSTVWRSVVSSADDIEADWGFVLAPPFLSLVDTRGHTIRRALDFAFPEVLDPRSFPVFWTLMRATAFDAAASGGPMRSTSRPAVALSPIDRHVHDAASFEDRVRSDLQQGVVAAMGALVRALERRGPEADRRFGEALTIVYRILFLLFAESRDLVPRHHPTFSESYTVGSLCREAHDSSVACGLWDAMAAITRMARSGCRAENMIVTPFNGRLFARRAAPTLEAANAPRRSTAVITARDEALRDSLVALATRPARDGRQPIRYADLGVEQLGAVYERILDLDPATVGRPAADRRPHRHSVRRKETGTFYTPQPLCDFIVRRTLRPLVSGRSADQILELRVLDPAMGSGAFLVAACRFLADAYDQARVEEGRLSDADLEEQTRLDSRRLIAERCLAGVDLNPVAVQLARLSLWLATLADGKPLGFLDHRLRAGNSLIGASPDDLRHVADPRRSPVRAFTLPLVDDVRFEDQMRRISRPLVDLAARRDNTVSDIHAKEAAWAALTNDKSWLTRWRSAASLWCARWFWPNESPVSAAEIRAAIAAVLANDKTLPAARLSHVLATGAVFLGSGAAVPLADSSSPTCSTTSMALRRRGRGSTP